MFRTLSCPVPFYVSPSFGKWRWYKGSLDYWQCIYSSLGQSSPNCKGILVQNTVWWFFRFLLCLTYFSIVTRLVQTPRFLLMLGQELALGLLTASFQTMLKSRYYWFSQITRSIHILYPDVEIKVLVCYRKMQLSFMPLLVGNQPQEDGPECRLAIKNHSFSSHCFWAVLLML